MNLYVWAETNPVAVAGATLGAAFAPDLESFHEALDLETGLLAVAVAHDLAHARQLISEQDRVAANVLTDPIEVVPVPDGERTRAWVFWRNYDD